MVKKPKTWEFLFGVIWLICGMLFAKWCFRYSLGIVSIEPYPITGVIWPIISLILLGIHQLHVQANREKWVYSRIRARWKFTEKPISTLLRNLSPGILFWLSLLVFAVLFCLLLLWIISDNNISKFIENISNFTSVILVFIFMVQAWIFYQQYRHMAKPFFKVPLLWALSKSNSDTDCCILLKNGGNVPIFDVSYYILEVLVKDGWVYKKVKSEEISKDLLPRLDSGFEKEILEKPAEEFKEMRLAVYLRAKTLDGHSTSLLFYKAPKAMDFRLTEIMHT